MTLVDSVAAAFHATAIRGRRLAPGTIRAWASHGEIERHGQDAAGRTLYDLKQVLAKAGACHVLTTGLDATTLRSQ